MMLQEDAQVVSTMTTGRSGQMSGASIVLRIIFHQLLQSNCKLTCSDADADALIPINRSSNPQGAHLWAVSSDTPKYLMTPRVDTLPVFSIASVVL